MELKNILRPFMVGAVLSASFAQTAISGGSGGGAPPPLETEHFEHLKNAVMNGNLLRHRSADGITHYLQAVPDMVGETEMLATDIQTGDKVVVKKAAEVDFDLQKKSISKRSMAPLSVFDPEDLITEDVLESISPEQASQEIGSGQ